MAPRRTASMLGDLLRIMKLLRILSRGVQPLARKAIPFPCVPWKHDSMGRKGRSSGAPGTSAENEKSGRSNTVAVAWIGAVGVVATAVASIVVAVVNQPVGPESVASSSATTPTSSPTSPQQSPFSTDPKVAITSFTQTPESGSGERVNVQGTVVGAGTDPQIYVVVQNAGALVTPASGSDQGGAWLVSPKADVRMDGHWSVNWDVLNPPASGKWTAVLVQTPICPPGQTCAPRPPEYALQQDGTADPLVVAQAVTSGSA